MERVRGWPWRDGDKTSPGSWPSLIHMTAADRDTALTLEIWRSASPWRSGAEGVALVHPSGSDLQSNSSSSNYNSTTTYILLHSTGDHLHSTRAQHSSVLHSSLHSTSLDALSTHKPCCPLTATLPHALWLSCRVCAGKPPWGLIAREAPPLGRPPSGVPMGEFSVVLNTLLLAYDCMGGCN